MDLRKKEIVPVKMSFAPLKMVCITFLYFAAPNEASLFSRLSSDSHLDCIKLKSAVSDRCVGSSFISTHFRRCFNLTVSLSTQKTPLYSSCQNGGHFKDKANTSCICNGSFTGSYCERYWEDCSEGLRRGEKMNCVHTIQPQSSPIPFEVFCGAFKGRTRIQWQDKGIDFYRSWHEYRDGFGEPWTDHWLGLDKVKAMTDSRTYSLVVRIKYGTMRQWKTRTYHNFTLSSEADGYRMSFYNTTSRRGRTRRLTDALTKLKGSRFSTYDRDNDDNPTGNCAKTYHSGWWFKNCTECNPNGILKPISFNRKMSTFDLHWPTTNYRTSISKILMSLELDI